MAHNHESARPGRAPSWSTWPSRRSSSRWARWWPTTATGSARAGAPTGPQAGYFPFYIGLFICICGAVVFVQGLLRLETDRSVFVDAGQFKQVLVILLPSTVYVLGVQLIGIYVSSALFIAFFMSWLGKYRGAQRVPWAWG